MTDRTSAPVPARLAEKMNRLEELSRRFVDRVEEIAARTETQAGLPEMVEHLRRENERLLRRIQTLERRQEIARRKIAGLLEELNLQGIR